MSGRDGSPAAVHLRAGGTSVVVQLDGGRLPRIVHWGEDLGEMADAEVGDLVRTGLPAIGDSPVTYPQPVPVLAQLAEGWLGRPGLVADSDGARWAAAFRTTGVRRIDDDLATGILVEAEDPAYRLRLGIRIELLRGSGLVRQRATLGNDGDAALRVGGIELALPVPPVADEVLDLTGRWSLERVPQRRRFDVGEWVRTSRGGKPGLEHTLLLIAGERGFGHRSGAVWATHLAWSGDQTLVAERTPAGSRRLVATEDLRAGEVVLAPGEEHRSPWQYGSWGEGLDDLAARFHRHLRASSGYPALPRPVVANTWETVYFRHDTARLVSLAEQAAAVGVERFVLDDGWFLGRRDDTSALGDWIVDPQAWPEGLAAFAERVRALGMDFGLWVEPEMVSLDSDLARAHPEWMFDAGHGPGMPSRHQHVLDLGQPEAYAHVREQISALVDEIGVAFLKWDHNRYLLDAGHQPSGVPGIRNQTLAAYRLMDELRQRHPGLEIESCASGGGRIDLGVLERTQRVWPSDCNDPHERLEIQRWTGLLVPPEYQGTHVGAETSHTTGRVHPLSYRAEKALWGNLGIEVDLVAMAEEERAELAAWIAFHKRHRQLLHTGTVVHADVPDPAVRLEGVVSADRSEALFAVSLVERPRTWPIGRLGLPGLDDDRRYRVRLADPVPSAAPDGPQPPWLTAGALLPGRVLRAVGLEMPSFDPDRSALLHVTPE